MSNNPPDPFIGLRMQENRTATGRRTSTRAKQAALYFAYGRNRQNQLEGQQRGEWRGPDGRIHNHEAVMSWAKQVALEHRYTFQAILSVPQAELNPEQFCQAMQQSGEISEWRLMMHQDTQHRHAHVLFFRDKRLDKKSFLAWQTAVRQELSRLEQQQLTLPYAPERQQEMQPEMVLDSESTHSRQQEVGLVQLCRSTFPVIQDPLYFKQFGATYFNFGTNLRQTALRMVEMRHVCKRNRFLGGYVWI